MPFMWRGAGATGIRTRGASISKRAAARSRSAAPAPSARRSPSGQRRGRWRRARSPRPAARGSAASQSVLMNPAGFRGFLHQEVGRSRSRVDRGWRFAAAPAPGPPRAAKLPPDRSANRRPAASSPPSTPGQIHTQLGNIEATERHPGEQAWCHLGRDQIADLGENRPSGGESTVVLLKKAAQMPWSWSLRSNQAIYGPVPRQVAPR